MEYICYQVSSVNWLSSYYRDGWVCTSSCKFQSCFIFKSLGTNSTKTKIVSRLGYYLPWPILAGAISAIGNGLVSTFTPSTPTAKWVGYQILLGAGRGSGMQMVCSDTLPDPLSSYSDSMTGYDRNPDWHATVSNRRSHRISNLLPEYPRLHPPCGSFSNFHAESDC